MSISVSRRSVFALRCSRDTATLVEWMTKGSMLRARNQGQPESIPAGLESQNDPSDHSTDFHRMIPPTLHQTQQPRWIGIQFLQGSSFNARNNSGGEPA